MLKPPVYHPLAVDSSPAGPASRPVWVLHYTAAPVVGGVEMVMAEQARTLLAHGTPVSLVAGRGCPQLLVPEMDSLHPGVLTVQEDLAAGQVPAAFERLRTRLRETLGVWLAGLDHPIVLAHNVFTLHKNLALTAALVDLAAAGAAHFVAWCHDLAWTNPLYQPVLHPGPPWDMLRRPCTGVTYLTISQTRRAELAELFGWPPEQVQWIPNGLDPTRFLGTSADMRTVLEQLAWWDRDLVLLAPVRMTRRKNLELALAVVAELKAAGHRPLLLITGPPGPHNPRQDYADFLTSERSRLEVDEEVQFLSRTPWLPYGVSDALMLDLYWWADALLFPSLQEGFGLPLLEAGLARLPIFCTDLPVLREVGGPHAHYFAPQAPPAAIARQIAAVLAAPGPAALRRRVLQVYNWDMIYQTALRPLLSR